MAIKITDECINCGACEPECPNTAIYEGGAEWKFSEGTSLKGPYTGKNSMITVDSDNPNEPVDWTFILLSPTNVQSVKDFMKNPSVQLFAP